MKVQPSIGPNAGFTLVESMLTLAIMSVALLALAGLQITALRGNDLSRRMTTAVAIAEQRIEQLKNTPYTTQKRHLSGLKREIRLPCGLLPVASSHCAPLDSS